MMIKKSKFMRYSFMVILALCLTAIFTFSTFNKVEVKAESEIETILVGDVIEARDYQIEHSGGSVTADNMTIVYPSGGVFGGESFEVKQAGIYQITYHAMVGNEKVEQTQKYKAIRRPQDLIVGVEGMQIGFGKYNVPHETLTVKKNVSGAIVNFKSGQTISFATKIQTEKLTADYNIFDLIVMPTVFGETDFERLTVRITDGKDQNNFVEIIIDSSNMVDGEGQVSYVRAGANGQQVGGYEGSNYHTSNYGTSVEHSFRGKGRRLEDRSEVIISECSLTVAIDNAERRVYCGPKSNLEVENLLVNDLDDASHYKGNPWGGFIADDVYVTITASKFSKAQGVVLIKKFGDFDLSQNIDDQTAPDISIGYDMSQTLPVAVVGQDFPLFPFEAKDVLDEDLKLNVWVYHEDTNGNMITIANDGEKFNAKYEGKYIISYSAEDRSGNKNQQTVVINAVKSKPNVFVAIDEPLIEAQVYSKIPLKRDYEMKAFGGSGILTVERAVYDPNKDELLVDDSLVLEKLGDYKVVYTVTDYLGNKEYGVITIRSLGTNAPIFVEEPTFESHLFKGFTYELPNPLVVETVNGELREIECEVYVNDVLTEGSFVAQGEHVNIVYVAKGQTGEVLREISLDVVDTEYGKYKSRYFYTEDQIAVTDKETHVEFAFAQNGKVEFVNSLSANNLFVALSYEVEKMNFSSMKIAFTDKQNANVKVTVDFSFDQVSDTWYMKLNGSKDKVQYTTSGGVFSLTYLASTRQIMDASGVEVGTITLCDNGDKFLGFSDRVYVSFEFASVREQSSVYVTQLCNQSMGYNKASIDDAYDEIEPVIVLSQEFVNRQKLGTKAIIPTALAFDVLGQIAELTISVEFKSQIIASGPANVPLDVMLSEAGLYRVVYYAEDNVGNNKRVPYAIRVSDETAPTLTVNGKVKSEYKLGAKVKIPKYSATDNGDNCYIQVELIMPNNELRLLHYVENGVVTSLLSFESKLYESAFKANNNAFYANQKGKYVLRFIAYDEYYNSVVQEFEFIVK